MIVFDTNINFNGATTQYLNFDYNSIVKFNNSFFCANELGLYKLDGGSNIFPENNTSNEIIESYFEPMTFDFDLSEQKRLRAVYIGYEANGDLTLKISTELSAEQSYNIPTTTNGQCAKKIVIRRSLKGRYWTFQFFGKKIYFAIDSIKILPIIRGHGFDQN